MFELKDIQTYIWIYKIFSIITVAKIIKIEERELNFALEELFIFLPVYMGWM